MNRAGLEGLAAQWRRQRAAITALWAAVAAVLGASVMMFWWPIFAAPVAIGVAGTTALVLRSRWVCIDASAVAAHLDRAHPELQESAGLWLCAEAELTPIEQVQRRRIDVVWQSLRAEQPRVGEPPRLIWRSPLVALVVALSGLIVALNHRPAALATAGSPIGSRGAVGAVPSVEVGVRGLRLTVTPPAYLAQAPFRVAAGDAEVPEGAHVAWEIETVGVPRAVRLEGVQAESPLLAEEVGGGIFRASVTLRENRLYRVALMRADGGEVRGAVTHVIKVVRDLPPRVEWREPAQARTLLEPVAGQRVSIALAASDDHAPGEGVLVVTVAKGSGEGVKFREVRRPLTRVAGADARAAVYTDELALDAFKLEPGDEVYFHALVSDRRTPTPNTTRSETRFVVVRGADSASTAPVGTLAGVNRLPPFFRSQRQVILDTERLIAERDRLDEATWLSRSQEIGVDQKLLRLRYGQFLGEEFEPASLGAPKEAEAMAFAGRLRTGAGKGSPQEAAVARAIEASHDHPVAPAGEVKPATVESLAAAFVHRHDNPEAATLFDTAVQASLRTILAAMWEAEGQLRSGRPVEALPAENRALELLKELQQADRVYVRRTAFEPAPLKEEERRLRGELETIPRVARSPLAAPDAATAATLAAEAVLRDAVVDLTRGLTVASGIRAELEARLAEAARRDPARHLAALEIWQRSEGRPSAIEQRSVVAALLALLPEGREQAVTDVAGDAALVRRYFDQLQREEGRR